MHTQTHAYIHTLSNIYIHYQNTPSFGISLNHPFSSLAPLLLPPSSSSSQIYKCAHFFLHLFLSSHNASRSSSSFPKRTLIGLAPPVPMSRFAYWSARVGFPPPWMAISSPCTITMNQLLCQCFAHARTPNIIARISSPWDGGKTYCRCTLHIQRLKCLDCCFTLLTLHSPPSWHLPILPPLWY